MTVRLRLSGEPAAARIPVRDDPPALSAVIAVVGACDAADEGAMARALAEAAGGARWRAQAWSREGSEIAERDGEQVLRAAPAELDSALEGLRAEGLVVALGAAFVALRRPALAILVTGGASPVQWDPDVRALRDRFQLIVEEPRPALARELVAAIRRRGAAAAT